MPYLNIDDGMDEHPKIEGLSDAAFRMHIAGMLYSARRKTDGAVPRKKAPRLSDNASFGVAAELVRAGVWHDIGDGCTDSECIEAKTCRAEGLAGHYVIHDYLQWNHSRAWWDKRRADEAERLRKYRSRKRSESDGT
jgi:hypothetical protein